MFKKAKIYSLLAIIVASTVVSLFSLPQAANAQEPDEQEIPTLYINPDLEKDIKTKGWRTNMLSCLRGNDENGVDVSYDDLLQGNWFPEPTATNDGNVGYLIEGTDGRYECGEDGFVDGFLGYFKWQDGFVAACKLGFRPTNNESASYEDCMASQTDSSVKYEWGFLDTPTDFAAAAIDEQASATGNYSAQALESSDRELHEPELYVLYMRTFQMACANGEPSTVAPTGGNVGNSIEVTAINGRGEATPVYYDTVNMEGDPIHVRRATADGRGDHEDKTCTEIAALINQNASFYQDYVDDLNLSYEDILKGSGTPPVAGTDEGESTCRINGIGWAVCPILNFLAGIVDDSYFILDNSLLRTAPLLIGETSGPNPLYDSWKIMRDFANIMFVIGFMVIVFSQVTSFGVSNYGLKKLLPKLILAAIMVNLSYFICAIAVDLSNILGNSLKGLLDTTIGNKIDSIDPSSPSESWKDGGGSGAIGWLGLTGLALGGSIFFGGPLTIIGFLVPVLFAAFAAIMATVITLVLRQVLIILLVFVSPLAFVALLLPNTEEYFKKWRVTFQTLLLLYPIIALVFGASALASKVITASAAEYDEGAEVLIQIMGAAAAVIPLFMTPFLLKLGGGLLNRWAGIVNDPNKGFLDKGRNASMKKVEQGQKMYSADALDPKNANGWKRPWRYRPGQAKIMSNVRGKERDSNVDSELALATASFNAGEAVQAGLEGVADAATLRKAARAQSTLNKLDNQEVDDAAILMTSEAQKDRSKPPKDYLTNQLKNANEAGDSVRARAAAKVLTTMGTPGNKALDDTIQEIMQDGGFHTKVDSDLRTSLIGSKTTNAARERWALETGNDRSKDLNAYYADPETYNSLTPEELAKQKDYVIEKGKTKMSSTAAEKVLEFAGTGSASLSHKSRAIFEYAKNNNPGATGGAAPSVAPGARVRRGTPSRGTGTSTPAAPSGTTTAPTGVPTGGGATGGTTSGTPGGPATGARVRRGTPSRGTGTSTSTTPPTGPAPTSGSTATSPATPTTPSAGPAASATATPSTPPATPPAPVAPSSPTTPPPTATPAAPSAPASPVTSTPTPSATASAASPLPPVWGGISADEFMRANKESVDKILGGLSQLKASGNPMYAAEIEALGATIREGLKSSNPSRDKFVSETGSHILGAVGAGSIANNIAPEIAKEIDFLSSARGEPSRGTPLTPPPVSGTRPDDV